MEHGLEYLTIGIYMLFLMGLGIVLSRINKNVSDYVRGGAQGTWWLVGCSAFMCSFSAYTFTANGSLAYQGGPTPLIIFFAISCGLLVCAFFIGPWLRQTRAITLADIIRERFGPEVEQFYVYLGLMLYPLNSSVQLWALSVFCSSVFGFPLIPTIFVFGLVVLFYATVGGRWAVMATDFLQSLILVPLTLLIAFLCLHRIGGIGAFLDHFTRPEFAADFQWIKPAGQFEDNSFTWPWALGMFLVLFFFEISFIQAQKYLSVKDGREARKSALLSMCLMFLGGFIFLLPPMVARLLFSEQVEAMGSVMKNPAESAYAIAALQVLPNGLVGILVVAMFAATMSSMDTGLNEATGQIVNNLFPALRRFFKRKDPTERGQLHACLLVTLCLGALVISYALLFATVGKIKIFDAFKFLSSVITLPVTLPFVLSLFIKRLPRWSYFVIVVSGMIPSLIAKLGWDVSLTGHAWNYQARIFWILSFAIITALATRLFFRTSSATYQRRVGAFFKRMHTPINFEEEVKINRDHFQFRVMGNTALIASGLLSLLLLVPNPLSGRLCVVFLCGFVAIVGALLKVAARRHI